MSSIRSRKRPPCARASRPIEQCGARVAQVQFALKDSGQSASRLKRLTSVQCSLNRPHLSARRAHAVRLRSASRRARATAGEQFLDFLRTRAAGCDALYILGDLFEAWVGDDDPDGYRSHICDGAEAVGGGRRTLLRHARQSGLPAAAGLRAAQRHPAAGRSGGDRSARRARAAHAWRCTLHRRSLLSAAARRSAQSTLAAALSAAAAARARRPWRNRHAPAAGNTPAMSPPTSWMSIPPRSSRRCAPAAYAP